jgi:integrase
VKKGKTVVLSAEEARKLLDSIDATSHVGLRDRALIALMVYTFARIGAALKMRVEDVYTQKRRTWVRLQRPGPARGSLGNRPLPDRSCRKFRPASVPEGTFF